MNRTGLRRWHDQHWLIDDAIASRGIEFDQNRLRYSLGPVRDQTATDIGILRASITKIADLTPVASVHAQRHEDMARQLEDRRHPATTDELIELHRRRTGAFLRWAEVADHTVEAVDIARGRTVLPHGDRRRARRPRNSCGGAGRQRPRTCHPRRSRPGRQSTHRLPVRSTR